MISSWCSFPCLLAAVPNQQWLAWMVLVGFLCAAAGGALIVGGVLDRFALALAAGGVAVLMAAFILIGVARAFS